MKKYLLASAPLLLLLSSCIAEVDDSESPTPADGADEYSAEAAGKPRDLNIGFNGDAAQFQYTTDFFAASIVQPGPRLCHTYVAWDVGQVPAHSGAVSIDGSRAYLENWLTAAAGHCDEALISFKALNHRAAPSVNDMRKAFAAFVAIPWATDTGFTGKFAFTPWNEPNNPADPGNGLGVKITADRAAGYFLALAKICEAHDCKVAAGDFASNGDMWNDFEFNCANDNVPEDQLCAKYSKVNTEHHAASYLDRYKNYIANHATDEGLPVGYRPAAFAFHGWHDVNVYIEPPHTECATYADCATRRLLQSLGSSWAIPLWDTEVGVGQMTAPDDPEQACGAAQLVRISTLSSRIWRVYYTRMHGGNGALEVGHTPRPAFDILAKRDNTAGGCTAGSP